MAQKPKVYITRKLPQKALDMINREYNFEINPQNRPLTRSELEEAIQGRDGMITMLSDNIDEDLLKLNPELKVIANYAVGYDNIDIDACNEFNVLVSNTPEVLTETTADFTWALLMTAAMRIAEADKFVRKKKYEGWSPMPSLSRGSLGQKTLGIIGFGRIGKAVAKRARGFGMKILYHEPSRLPEEEEIEHGASYRKFEDLLKESDFVTLHLPLLESTRHLIGEQELKIMKETAYLINTARGAIIDEKALKRALEKEEIAGAALDVFEEEPALTPGLSELENVILTPHIASASRETRTQMAVIAAENLIAGLKGEEMPNLVNPSAKS